LIHTDVLAHVVVLELVLGHVYHDIIKDEPTGIHNLFHLYTERSLLRNLLVRHVASREVADAEIIAYAQHLGTLTCAGWSDGGKTHEV
jgi:hypothetical protein